MLRLKNLYSCLSLPSSSLSLECSLSPTSSPPLPSSLLYSSFLFPPFSPFSSLYSFPLHLHSFYSFSLFHSFLLFPLMCISLTNPSGSVTFIFYYHHHSHLSLPPTPAACFVLLLWLPYTSSYVPSTLPPQGLCTCYSLWNTLFSAFCTFSFPVCLCSDVNRDLIQPF